MTYTKQQLIEMYEEYAKKKITEGEEFRKNYIPEGMREQGSINTLLSLTGGKNFLESLE